MNSEADVKSAIEVAEQDDLDVDQNNNNAVDDAGN